MMKSNLLTAAAAAAAGILVLPAGAWAQTVTWDGNGDSNASGNWGTPANWSTDAVPTAADNAVLGDVTSGTRTVTVESSFVVDQVTFTQTTVGAVNRLAIGAGNTLTVDRGGQRFGAATNATAGVGSVVADVNGSLVFSAFNPNSVFANTLNLGNGSLIDFTGHSSDLTTGFVGVVNSEGSAMVRKNSDAANWNVNVSSGAVMNVNSGTMTLARPAVVGGNSYTTRMTVQSGAALNVFSGSTFSINNFTGSGNRSAQLENQGGLLLQGKLQFGANGGSSSNSIVNSGTLVVSGTSTSVEMLAGNGTVPTLTMTNSGTIKGASASDGMTFTNLESSARLALANDGTIQAGDGTGGSGLSSVGSFTLTNVDLTLGAASQLEFDLGGTGLGQFDVLDLNSGNLLLDGTLAITLVNGFAPGADFDLDIITGDSSITGAFDTLLVNGMADSAYSFTFSGGVGTLHFTAVPEPQTMVLAGLAAGFFLVRRRRPLS